ncbi:MAG: proton-conducting transporter membrane subunit [Candidatus Methylumidiphilus sp.]
MLNGWTGLAPLPPLLAAALIACGMLAGRIRGEASERFSSGLALSAATLSLLLVLAAALSRAGGSPEAVKLGAWIESGGYRVDVNFLLDGLGLAGALLVAGLGALVSRYAAHYLHREAGFHRFFLILSLFLGAMLLLATAGNAGLAFAGWELAGLSSYLLIAYHYERPTATANATRVLVTNRVGDAGFVLGIALAFQWTGGIAWADIAGQAVRLERWQAETLACCFLTAAAAKSAQVPFAPWLARAMEGPTPSSAVFYGALLVHAGVFLLLRLQALFAQAPLATDLLAAAGLLTALYGFLCGLAQSDVKSALAFATVGQVGLMFAEAGLGLWQWAQWHLCAHAVFRVLQFLAAPSLLHQIAGLPARPVPAWLGRNRMLYAAVLQRFWLEAWGDWLLAKPTLRMAADLDAFDHQVVAPLFGLPAPSAGIDNAAGERRLDGLPPPDSEVFRVSGAFGALLLFAANAAHWFEEKLVLQGVGQNLPALGRRLGRRLHHVEDLLNQPRYLAAIILATLLAVL